MWSSSLVRTKTILAPPRGDPGNRAPNRAVRSPGKKKRNQGGGVGEEFWLVPQRLEVCHVVLRGFVMRRRDSSRCAHWSNIVGRHCRAPELHKRGFERLIPACCSGQPGGGVWRLRASRECQKRNLLGRCSRRNLKPDPGQWSPLDVKMARGPLASSQRWPGCQPARPVPPSVQIGGINVNGGLKPCKRIEKRTPAAGDRSLTAGPSRLIKKRPPKFNFWSADQQDHTTRTAALDTEHGPSWHGPL